MPFTSLSYYLFLALTLALYVTLPRRWRSILLVCASFGFYLSFNPWSIVFILNTVLVSYWAARWIGASQDPWRKKAALGVSVGVELTLLFITKYWNPLAESTHLVRPLSLLVPLGISFYSFQSIGYVIDVYRGKIQEEKVFSRYALFVSFFPHLLAGPIEPAQHFLPQIDDQKKESTQKLVFSGVLLILMGLLKKLVIAENLGAYVDLIFNNPGSYHGAAVALGILLAKYQIYADFSGYTDIALGSAMMFGYQLTENFKRPFFSKNISEYWNRWHISLSQWIKNYIFYPLLATPFSALGAKALAILTFLILGLWHGGTFNFLIYGLIQGILVSLDSGTRSWRLKFYKETGIARFPRLLNGLAITFTFLVLVVPPTIFFRSPDLATTSSLFHHMLQPGSFEFLSRSVFLKQALITALCAVIIYEIIDWVHQTKINLIDLITNKPAVWFYLTVFIMILGLFLLGRFDSGSSFIYTQF